MASEVYVLSRNTPKEAWWQLPEVERQSSIKRSLKERADAGVAIKTLARFSVGPSVYIVVQMYPDMDSYHKSMMIIGPQGLNVQRYWDYEITLGHEAPPLGTDLPLYAQDDLPLV